MSVPSKYEWLVYTSDLPRAISEGLMIYGVAETRGARHNPVILGWAWALGVGNIYKSDEMAWCGLATGYLLFRAGEQLPFGGYSILRARMYRTFGVPTSGPPMLGDVLVFNRRGGGHVGFYIAESANTYHVMGGNQGNRFCITEIDKRRMIAARRPNYTIQPTSVRRMIMSTSGVLSTNEA